MRYLTIALVMLLASCSGKQVLNSSPLGYSFMPKYLSLDSIGPKIPSDPSLVIDTSFEDYKAIPIKLGVYALKNSQGKVDSITLPRGVLFSEKKTAYYLFYEAEYKRMKTQLYYSDYLAKTYYDKSLAAEKLYQDEIIRLRKEAERSWLEKNIGYLGFASGILTAILTEVAVIKLSK